MVGTGKRVDADEFEQRVGRLGPEDARRSNLQIGRREDVVDVEVAGAWVIGGVAGVVGRIAAMTCVGAALELGLFGGAE
jgi:hypothetical protein